MLKYIHSGLIFTTKFILITGLSLFISCQPNPVKEDFKAFIETVGEGKDIIKIAVVKGSPKEMGRQLGDLLGDEIEQCMEDFVEYAQAGDPQMYSNEKLDLAWAAHSPYIDNRIVEEMEGMAETSLCPVEIIRRAHMIPVISSHACSGVAVWGQNSADGHTYQLRNLDFSMGAGLQDHPLIVIYIPERGLPHANVSFAGYIASHTGINASQLAMGEKGESPSSEFPYDIEGAHFSFLFRSMLYDATSLDEILTIIENTPLIKRYYLYFSDGDQASPGGVKMLVSSPNQIKYSYWRDNDPADPLSPNVLPECIYHTKENNTAYSLLYANQGEMDHNKMIELSRAVADNDDNLMNVVYDVTDMEIWASFANNYETAASRPYVKIDLAAFFDL